MGPLDNESMMGMEKELEEEVRGLKPVNKRRLLTKCADYLLLEDRIPSETMEMKVKGYSP
jgi:hypothetical protein